MRGTPQHTLDQLHQVGRHRALTECESIRLEVALRRINRRQERQTKPWGNGDDITLAFLLADGIRPPQIALRLGRTERAIWRRIYKLGGQASVIAKGSIANTARGK